MHQEAIRDAIVMIEKYGEETMMEAIGRWRPDILEEVKLQLEELRETISPFT